MAGPPKVTKIKTKAKIPPKPVRKPSKKSGPTVHGKPAVTMPPRDLSRFTLEAWDRTGEGEKVLLYGMTGMGKTSLAAQLENAAFVGTDDGGRLIKNPYTDADLVRVPQIEDFQDARDVMHSNVFDPVDWIVIDTLTELQRWGIPHILQTVPKEKGGQAKHLEDYGWRKGYRHWYEAMEMFLSDCNRWVRAGKNIVFLCQETGIKMTNEGGEDYRVAGPDLYHDAQVSILNLVKSWCDHVFRINYANLFVEKKKASSTNKRAVFIHPTVTFIAKSRTIPADWTSVTFDDKADNSIWQLLANPQQEGGE